MYKIFKTKRIWLFTLLIVILFFLTEVTAFREFSLELFAAPLRFFSNIGKTFESKKELQLENTQLKQKIGDMFIELEQLKELDGENQRLRELLAFTRKNKFNTISCEVIARNPNDWVGSFIIDKGTKDGIVKNAAVCSAKGLLGKVVDPREETSTVVLLIHPSFKAGGMIKSTRINGIIEGSGKDTVKMLYLPLDAKVEEKDVVVTSAFSRMFPKGIPIGEVESVEKSRSGLYKYAIIKPFADLFGQEEVLVIK